MPRVTVGVPAYNNETTLAATLESIFAQTVEDIEILISDDGSSDGTWDICREFQKRDGRVRIFRQPDNLYYHNFRFLLERASALYFVWLAGDDTWSPTYLEECMAVLDARPEVVGCVSRCQFETDGKPTSLSLGTAALESGWKENVAAYLRAPNDNTRMYGVFRIEALRATFPSKIIHAYDWALMAGSLKYGKHAELPKVLMTRDQSPPEYYVRSMERDNSSHFFRLFPVIRMTLHLVFGRKIPMTLNIVLALVFINLVKHVEYMRFVHPTAFSRLSWLYWRLYRWLQSYQ